jgi:hypothetical protein
MITHHVSQHGFGVAEVPAGKIRAAIFQAERIIASVPPGTQAVDCSPTKHLFVHGVYAREVFLPAGSWNTGKLHTHEDLLIIAKGRVTFYTENGATTLEGPCMTTVKAMTKPLVHAHEDTWMYSAHVNPNGHTDPDAMERELIVPCEIGEVPKCLS